MTALAGLFDKVDPRTSAELAQSKRAVIFAAGQDLYTVGATPAQLHCFCSGRVKVWRPGRGGGALTLYYLGEGDVSGLVAIARAVSMPVTLTAVTRVEAFVWPAALVRRLLAQDGQFASNALRIVAVALQMVVDRLEDVTGASAEQQIGRALLRLAGEHAQWHDDGTATIAVSRQEIADLTGTTLYTASRMLSDWGRQGVVVSLRGRVVIHDFTALARIAGVEGMRAGD